MSYRQFPELTPVEEKMGFKLIGESRKGYQYHGSR